MSGWTSLSNCLLNEWSDINVDTYRQEIRGISRYPECSVKVWFQVWVLIYLGSWFKLQILLSRSRKQGNNFIHIRIHMHGFWLFRAMLGSSCEGVRRPWLALTFPPRLKFPQLWKCQRKMIFMTFYQFFSRIISYLLIDIYWKNFIIRFKNPEMVNWDVSHFQPRL